MISPFFFFNDTATTEIYTLSLHDALPISTRRAYVDSSKERSSKPIENVLRRFTWRRANIATVVESSPPERNTPSGTSERSEEHTSELQSLAYLVCRLLLEKKNSICTVCES